MDKKLQEVILKQLFEATSRLEISCKMPVTLATYCLQLGWNLVATKLPQNFKR